MNNKKIRVLQYGLGTHLGGIETYLFKIASNLDFDRFQMDFVYFGENKPCFYAELCSLGCKMICIKTSQRFSPIAHRKEIRKILVDGQYDILHCNVASLSYTTIATEALKAGCKVVLVGHNGGVINGRAKWLHRINHFLLPYKKMKLVAVSELAGKNMFGNYPYEVHNNGLNTSLYAYNEINRNKIRQELGLSDEEVIVHCGSMKPEKNHLFMLDVFAEYLKSYNSKSRLLLVGTGLLLPDIKSKMSKLGIGNNVILLGLRNDIPAILSAADKFLFPSLYEGFPCALIEAESAGLPCVISDTITRQAVVNELTKTVALDADLNTWAAKINEANTTERSKYPNVINNMGLGITENMNKLYDIYQKVLEQ